MNVIQQHRSWISEHALQIVVMCELVAALIGAAVGVWSRRTRLSGWVGLILLAAAAGAAFANTFEPPNFPIAMLISLTFFFSAPCGVLYSFYSLARAHGRLVSLCSFAISIPVAVFFLISLILTFLRLFGARPPGAEIFP